jgi:hypothetical protein
MLEGWWLSAEEARRWCPFISEKDWDRTFRETGFSGIEVVLRDFQDPDLNGVSVFATSVVDGDFDKNPIAKETLVLTVDDAQECLARSLVDKLAQQYGLSNVSVVRYTDLTQRKLDDALCISLVELERSVAADPTEEEFVNIRHLLSTCGGLLWVTGDFVSDPHLNTFTGLVRAMRWERDLKALTLSRWRSPTQAPLTILYFADNPRYFRLSVREGGRKQSQ